MNTTVGSRRARLVRNTIAGLALVATVGTLAACGNESSDAPTQSPTARAVAAAQGSDRHLELKAAEVFRAEQRQAAHGSDRHLELRAGEIFRSAQRRQAVGVYETPTFARRQQVTYGSDRHLEQLAKDVAARAQWARRTGG